jgi:hypothetical protein
VFFSRLSSKVQKGWNAYDCKAFEIYDFILYRSSFVRRILGPDGKKVFLLSVSRQDCFVRSIAALVCEQDGCLLGLL